MKRYSSSVKAFFFVIGIFFISCQSDDNPVSYEKASNQYTNIWMLEQMKKYYYWNEELPFFTNLSLSPKDYFEKLLNTDDRFSYAVNPSDPETAPKSIRNTYGFDISFIEYNGQAFGVVLFVLTDSPAERSGLKRGQFIKSINGTTVSHQNFENLYSELASSGNAQLQLVEYAATAGFSAIKNVEIIRSFTFSQPVKYNVLLSDNEKVGYMEIPHFDVGLAATFLKVFKEFQKESVTKIIVDLRYNGGGDVSSAAALSIILAPNIKPDDLFIKFKGNKNGGLVNKTFKEALEMNESQVNFETLRTAHPTIQEVYILSGNHTASASEIIINNLKPYMNVIVIGDKTTGKDAAGFAIEDDRIADKRGWVLYPVIYKLFNARNEGNYTSGINPNIELNELQEMEIFPLGDIREILLNKALKGTGRQKSVHTVKKLLLNKTYIATDPFLKIY
ncbi:S41 family peptidase [Flavobacterium ajazii]|uniref:S41 family peptidase n=1 Tax=Flavobacterium ajazii TaxID=2692318 RepID=UPI0013D46508|nr:S41 family peptidase [Flavobacterium ajazii]